PPQQSAILVLSSAMESRDSSRIALLGIHRHLLKPIRRSVLRQAIADVFCSAQNEAATPLSELQATERRLRALLVEDNRVNQKLAVRILEKMGHEAVVAANGQEAVDLVKSSRFDLILMDIQMPVMGGLEATRQIRALEKMTGRSNVIIAMTAHAMA